LPTVAISTIAPLLITVVMGRHAPIQENNVTHRFIRLVKDLLDFDRNRRQVGFQTLEVVFRQTRKKPIRRTCSG
jgi:hypothetical protein